MRKTRRDVDFPVTRPRTFVDPLLQQGPFVDAVHSSKDVYFIGQDPTSKTVDEHTPELQSPGTLYYDSYPN